MTKPYRTNIGVIKLWTPRNDMSGHVNIMLPKDDDVARAMLCDALSNVEFMTLTVNCLSAVLAFFPEEDFRGLMSEIEAQRERIMAAAKKDGML